MNTKLMSVLILAKEQVNTPDKWCQNTLYAIPNRCCFTGALLKAQRQLGDYNEANEAENCLLIAKGIGVRCANGYIASWNDDPTRTHQDILDAFDRCIALCKE